MKKSIKAIALLLFTLIHWYSDAQEASLTVEISNIESIQGTLFVSLTNDSTQFASFTNSSNSQIKKVKVENHNTSIIFSDLQAGWYAIAIFQDLNLNDSLDTKRFKIPAEPFGFSNNAIARFRPPWFKDAQFYIDENKQNRQEVILVYRKPRKK